MNASLIIIVLKFALLTFAKAQDEVLDLIKSSGYEGEAHEVETEDGYLLKVHRVLPKVTLTSTSKFPVLLQHGLFSTASDYLITGPNIALAFLLADYGYDVWLGNVRGNKHSMNHRSFSKDSDEFWNFSWHEMGVYDLPAMIDFILNVTNTQKTFYVGHSQGATVAMVMLSMKPEFNHKIIQAHLMGPAVFMENIPHYFIKLLVPELVNGLLEDYTFLNFEDVWYEANPLIELLCGGNNTSFCEWITFALLGSNKEEVETEKVS